jgi:hypothetical protein
MVSGNLETHHRVTQMDILVAFVSAFSKSYFVSLSCAIVTS